MKQLLKQLAERRTEYQPVPFWSWNDKLEPDELKRQIRWMRENGIGGFFMHARGGLKTPYLSEEWMECIRVCCEEAQKQDMHAWAYDENGWPSGFVGGKLLEKPENHDMYILHNIGKFDAKADVNYLIAQDTLLRTSQEEENQEYLNLYIRYSASTVDILNPEVVDQFLNETHERYKQQFESDFSDMIKGFFTDEPQYYRWETPYTPMVTQYFAQVYQEDILDKLGLLFVEKEGYREFRYRYWLAMQRLMLENFAKKVYTWCEEHGVKLTGHYVEEVTMGYQIMCCGGAMPFYEYEHIPGIDWLGKDTDNELSPRQLGSAARQLGKKHAITETFGCCGWDVSPGELRRIAGFQYTNGVNLMCHHLIAYSEHGQRKRDCPVHFNPINQWVKEHFKEFNDYFSRLGYLLATGEEPVNVAMLHPIRSAYFDYKRGGEAEAEFGVKELDDKLHEACRMFSSRGIAYHFLDETLMEQHGFVKEGKIGCGQCTYDYLVLPKILTMGKHTEALIHKFVEQGGRLLLLEEPPEYLEGQPYDYSYLESNCTLEEIQAAQPFEVKHTDTEIYCAYREIGEIPFLFVQNASGERCYSQEFVFRDGTASFTALDPVTFEMKKVGCQITLSENGAMLLFPSKEAAPKEQELTEYALQFQEAEVDFSTNYLTMDTVRYSKDGTHYSRPVLRHRLFNQLLQERYKGKLWVRYEFEIQKLPPQLVLIAEKGNAGEFYLNGNPLTFTHTCEDEPAFYKEDITAMVHMGKNVYEAVLDWYQSESTYYALFGENVTESLANCIAYESELEAAYLAGDFGVYSVDGFEEFDDETVCAHDFFIGERPKRLSEPTTQGLTFFRGSLKMKQKINLSNKNTLLRLEGRYLTAKVKVNGSNAGELLFDSCLDISSYAKEGENEIEVEFVIGNRNLFGPFHCSWPEKFVNPQLFGLCNLEDHESGAARYRFYKFYV